MTRIWQVKGQESVQMLMGLLVWVLFGIWRPGIKRSYSSLWKKSAFLQIQIFGMRSRWKGFLNQPLDSRYLKANLFPFSGGLTQQLIIFPAVPTAPSPGRNNTCLCLHSDRLLVTPCESTGGTTRLAKTWTSLVAQRDRTGSSRV